MLYVSITPFQFIIESSNNNPLALHPATTVIFSTDNFVFYFGVIFSDERFKKNYD